MRRLAFIASNVLAISLLAGCMMTPEERLAEGMSETRKAFEKEAPETNKTAGQTKLYLPGGYDVEEPSDEKNVIITKNGNSYILYNNPNEAADSKFFYDLLKANGEQEWLVDRTFEQNGRFGFAALKEIAEDQIEVVISAGGVKLTTISETADVPRNMEWMMKTVRSIEE